MAKTYRTRPVSLTIRGAKVQTWTMDDVGGCVRQAERVLGIELQSWVVLALKAYRSIRICGHVVTIERI